MSVLNPRTSHEWRMSMISPAHIKTFASSNKWASAILAIKRPTLERIIFIQDPWWLRYSWVDKVQPKVLIHTIKKIRHKIVEKMAKNYKWSNSVSNISRLLSLFTFFTMLMSVLDLDLHGGATFVFFDLFRNWSGCFGSFGCFDMDSKHRNEAKIFFVSRKNRKSTKTDWVSVCFGSNRNFFVCFVETQVFMLLFHFFWFVSKQIYFFRLFRNG
jgi:hypothetical protein